MIAIYNNEDNNKAKLAIFDNFKQFKKCLLLRLVVILLIHAR